MASVERLCDTCRKERRQFVEGGIASSPACAELWRLAFAPNQDAWSCITSIFDAWLNRVAGAAIQKTPNHCGLCADDSADIVQCVWANVWRYHVRNPGQAVALAADDSLGRVVGLLRTTAKRCVLERCRKLKPEEVELPLEDPVEYSDSEPSRRSLLGVPPAPSDTLLDILDLLKRSIVTAQEYIVAELMLLQNLKPQDVFELRPDQFGDVTEVNQVRQTLIRRIRADHARQKTLESASLQYRLDADEVRMTEIDICPHDEDTLIEYIFGNVSPELSRAIERSPACMRAVSRLREEIGEWQPSLRQLFCPPIEQLVAYQERRLAGTESLLLRSHVMHCSYCAEELNTLAAMDEVRFAVPASLARRIFELIFQPATVGAAPVLGEGTYRTIERTPQIELLVRTMRTTAKADNWMLMGRIRYEGDAPVAEVESVALHDVDDESAAPLSAAPDETGTFVFAGLEEGRYRLRILTQSEELVLPELRIGDSN